MTPRVWNKQDPLCPKDAVYVGRPSKWGNPYRIGKDGTREGAVAKYRENLETRIATARKGLCPLPDFRELRGKDLVCWCAPLPCHADVLLELANKEKP